MTPDIWFWLAVVVASAFTAGYSVARATHPRAYTFTVYPTDGTDHSFMEIEETR